MRLPFCHLSPTVAVPPFVATFPFPRARAYNFGPDEEIVVMRRAGGSPFFSPWGTVVWRQLGATVQMRGRLVVRTLRNPCCAIDTPGQARPLKIRK